MKDMTKRLVILASRIDAEENSIKADVRELEYMVEDLQKDVARGNYHRTAQLGESVTRLSYTIHGKRKSLVALKDSFAVMKEIDPEAAEEYRKNYKDS